MKEFRFCNYDTRYSCTGDYNIDLGSRACFGAVFNYLEKHPHKVPTITYNILINTNLDNTADNICFLNQKEIINHIRLVKNLFPFNFKVVTSNDCWLTIQLAVKGTILQHKYILTWIRYLYEFPFNVILKDTYHLKKAEFNLFRFESIANLINVIQTCFADIINSNHSAIHPYGVELIKNKQLATILSTLDSITLHNVYTPIVDLNENDFKIDIDDVFNLEYWNDDKLFYEYRIPKYINLYNKIK